jgi:hypothetical protein
MVAQMGHGHGGFHVTDMPQTESNMAYSAKITALLEPTVGESPISVAMREAFRIAVVPAFDPKSDLVKSTKSMSSFRGLCEVLKDVLVSKIKSQSAKAQSLTSRSEKDNGAAKNATVDGILRRTSEMNEHLDAILQYTAERQQLELELKQMLAMVDLCSDWWSYAEKKLSSPQKKHQDKDLLPSNADQNCEPAHTASGHTSTDCSPNSVLEGGSDNSSALEGGSAESDVPAAGEY